MDIETLKKKTKEIYLLGHASAILGWDQETYIPPSAIEERGDQLALLQGIIHERMTDPEIGHGLDDIDSQELDFWDAGFHRMLKREYNQATKLSKDLVMRIAKAVSSAQAAWAKAKESDDFKAFEPHLAGIVDLVKEKAECLGYDGHIYNALIEEYEPGMTVDILDDVLVGQAPELSSIVKEIGNRDKVDDSFLWKSYDVKKQEEFGRFILDELGFPMDRGRLDITAHPFTTTLGSNDVRITTHYQKDFFNSALFGTIHEAGHGFYELGFGEEISGNILATGTSLGIHESQSRTWENIVGRSYPFWERYYSKLQSLFPENLKEISLDQFYRAINKVEPSFIRIEADEVTYNLHIILRYTIEKALVAGDLKVADLPSAWNDTFQQYFGITPPSSKQGVLQDIHWSMGAIGYFPTYALGNLTAAQFAETISQQVGDLDSLIREGKFAVLKEWLRENIFKYGSAKISTELIRDISGNDLSVEPFLAYVKRKFGNLYSL